MKKCAFIRSDKKGDQCPFGLPITKACMNAGESVTHMCPTDFVEDEGKKERVKKANKRIYIYHKTGGRCLYAADVMEKFDSVNCNFGDTAAGMHGPAFTGSPLYAQSFGTGIDGLYGFPMGMYSDNSQSRNLFFGLFSLVSEQDFGLIKEAILENENMKSIVEKLEDSEDLTTEERLDLEREIKDCRIKYEDNRSDPAKANELAREKQNRKM